MIAFIVASSEPTDEATLEEYGLRFDIEESKRSEKSGGYQIHLSHLAQPEAAFAPEARPGPGHPVSDQSWGQRRSRPTSERSR